MIDNAAVRKALDQQEKRIRDAQPQQELDLDEDEDPEDQTD